MKRIASLIVAAALAAFAVGIPAVAGAEPGAPLPKEVRVSYARSPFNLPLIVAVRRGMLDEAFAAKGVAVKLFEIDSGAKQAEAMAAGSIDIAGVINNTSVILAAAGGNDLKIVSGFSSPTGLFAIVVKDPAIKAVADLKGRKVAGPKGTVLHQLLASALERERLSLRDLEFIQMDIPAARTALLSGQVDAALLAAANILSAKSAGARVLVTAEGYVKPQLFVAARAAFIRDYPELVDLYASVHREALAWIEAHPEEALAIGAKEQGVSIAEAREMAAASRFVADLGPAELAALGEDIRFLKGAGMLSVDVEPSSLFRPGLVR
jgi:NitT/TauT family transport system substrate-binding protein/sulfonate transport system substrate-binding protein